MEKFTLSLQKTNTFGAAVFAAWGYKNNSQRIGGFLERNNVI
jgi:hypothetical protein